MAKKAVQKEKRQLRLIASIFLIAITFVTTGIVFTQREAGSQESGEFQQESSDEKITLGYSEEGRPINGYVFGNGDECVLFYAGLHGTEKGATRLLDRLAREIDRNPALVSADKKVVIIPIANPDGYETREDKLNANGVNLNRNFFTSDWVQHEDPDDPTAFAGTEPFSESESRVLKSVVESCQPSVMIAYHSQGAVVTPELGDASHQLADWYIEKTGYRYYDEWDYAGTATKWFTQTFGNPSLTVELTNHVDDDWEINKEALLELISAK